MPYERAALLQARPMTSNRGAGFSSNPRGRFDPLNQAKSALGAAGSSSLLPKKQEPSPDEVRVTQPPPQCCTCWPSCHCFLHCMISENGVQFTACLHNYSVGVSQGCQHGPFACEWDDSLTVMALQVARGMEKKVHELLESSVALVKDSYQQQGQPRPAVKAVCACPGLATIS